VYVEGRLRTRSWDGQDGQKRFRVEINANRVIFLDRKVPASELPEGDFEEFEGAVAPEELPFE
ncbi:MAG: single-stranded DNA-binding protein, partial [Chloroflexi bacterium]|nr:single-stranded DNA-binding protein [Chloroflexota bacterium]